MTLILFIRMDVPMPRRDVPDSNYKQTGYHLLAWP